MYLQQLFCNKVLMTCVVAWLLSCLIKGIIVCVKNKKLDFTRFMGSGGMPSSHSTIVTCLAICAGLYDGFDTTAFAICCVLALVVMYDASGIRRAAGQQAKIINLLIDEWNESDPVKKQQKLKELLGHTPVEVIAGAVFGALCAIVSYMMLG